MEKIGKMSIQNRMMLLYILFVIIPVLFTDGVVVATVYNSERTGQYRTMENEAETIHGTFFNHVDEAARLAKGVYTSYYVNKFLNRQFESNLDYYIAYKQFFDDTLIKLVDGQSRMRYYFYLDNDTITNGSEFHKLSVLKDSRWYAYMKNSGQNSGLFFDCLEHDENVGKRKIYFFQRLNYYDNSSENILLIELDYGTISRTLSDLKYERDGFICNKDKILLSTGCYSDLHKEYNDVSAIGTVGYSTDVHVYGQDLSIIVAGTDHLFWKAISARWYLILPLLLVNILLPVYTVRWIVGWVQETLAHEQEMILARKNAELLALHSQINPHFLFNALESIRMHSLLKDEKETSVMVERLAKLQRQYSEWQEDNVLVEKELEFAEAYLELQKYRFGDRLSFDIDVSDDCRNYYIPKLSLVTFVENACVHGIESKKTPGWIFVRIFEKDENLFMEVEDTGMGMTEAEAENLLSKMRNASLDMLKEKGRVGIVNACLRLKLISREEVRFDLDSEERTGTLVQITVPVKYLRV